MWHIYGALVYRSWEVGSWRCRSGHRSRILHGDELIHSSVRTFAAMEGLGGSNLVLTITVGTVSYWLGPWSSV